VRSTGALGESRSARKILVKYWSNTGQIQVKQSSGRTGGPAMLATMVAKVLGEASQAEIMSQYS
jgi:hypothetical protein